MDDKTEEYTRVAYYYYKAGLTQEEIAGKMNMSRQRVNRILGKCENLGIVQIIIKNYDKLNFEMESELEKKYGLASVRIVETEGPQAINTSLGSAASRYLADILQDGDVIGFSRGRATSALVEAIQPVNKKRLTVTQLVGGWNGLDATIDVDDIVNRFAQKLHAAAVKLYAPIIVHNPAIRTSIMGEPSFKKAYSVVRSCSVAVVGIGIVENREPHTNLDPGLEEMDFSGYREKKAVGEICAHFFDIEGNSVTSAMDERIIAVTLEDFLRIPRRIGIAGLPEKAEAIEGAVRGKYINVLITDLSTARTLLNR